MTPIAAVPGSADARGGGRRKARVAHRLLGRPAILYLLLTPLAFPILEMLTRGELGTQFAVDVFDGDIPVLSALRSNWIRYGPTLWDPHLTAGNASLAQLALPPTTPDVLLSLVLPIFIAYAVTYAGLIWVAGYGMHLFLRDVLHLHAAACVVGAVVYLASFWHYIHGFAIPLLPFTLLLTDRWSRATVHRWRYSVALVAVETPCSRS